MKFSATALVCLVGSASAFVPPSALNVPKAKAARTSRLNMAFDNPLPPDMDQILPASEKLPQFERKQNEPLYSEFLAMINTDKIEKVVFSADGESLRAIDTEGARLEIPELPNDPDLVTELAKHNVDVTVDFKKEGQAAQGGGGGGLGDLAQSLIFPAILFAGLFFLTRRSGGGMPGGGGFGGPMNPMGFGKSKAKIDMVADTGVSFDDVAGCDEAKKELEEVVDFLKQPEAYTKNGAIIPRGVILDGPPGTGKTLLAKAVAGEASVPFISATGSEFVEMFVGVGASRVRDIFSQAKKNAPCIIFIDEIDAVGRQRGAGYAGGNDEREQTINQILTEMDGFVGNPGIILIAATNRADILDQALLRPGRFDRKVTVELPDFRGRQKILEVHSRGRPLEPDVDIEAIARRTPGFSGAQLENLMNEASITAARTDKSMIGWEAIDEAVDRILVGQEKRGGNTVLKRQELVAYHEAGHAIVGALMPDYDQVQKISIVPRSNGAGGLTFFAPADSRLDSGDYTRQYLESQLAVALGGRLAEEIIYGEECVTTGASNDIQQVASIAKSMVKELGMNENIGPVALSTPQEGGPFMGRAMGTPRTKWGTKIQGDADVEIERLVNNSYLRAKKVLTDNRALLDHLAKTLVDQEVVSAEEFQTMLVQFRANTVEFDLLPSEQNRESLPYQELPIKM